MTWYRRIFAAKSAVKKEFFRMMQRKDGWLVKILPDSNLIALEKSGLFDYDVYFDRFPELRSGRLKPERHYLNSPQELRFVPCIEFDSAYYLASYPDVAEIGIDPFLHYCRHGWRELRNPSPFFDAAWYSKFYLRGRKQDPLLHYLRHGRKNGFKSCSEKSEEFQDFKRLSIFDEKFYQDKYPDVVCSGVDPLVHYVRKGMAEKRMPMAYFDPIFYIESNPDVAKSSIDPVFHYCRYGWIEGRNPSPKFDVKWYIKNYLDGNLVEPLSHYLREGRGLGYATCPDMLDRLEIEESGLFDLEFYLATNPDVLASGVDPLKHYLDAGASEGRSPSVNFDSAYYIKNNPDAMTKGENPLLHFLRHGWRELRNPSPRFDIWWYWSNYLDPSVEDVNPLVHFVKIGEAAGLLPKPDVKAIKAIEKKGRAPAHLGEQLRRICIFAGYDSCGIVDEYVVDYVRELSKYADVYCFFDGNVLDSELSKLAGLVKGVWSENHKEYDFGSYSRAIEKIGWGEIENYDELMLVNDSCYLLGGLDQVFMKMDSVPTDWWGMQATKGIASTSKKQANLFRRPIKIENVRNHLLGQFEKEYFYDFLVGSYFLVFRRSVFSDARFRKMLSSVSRQRRKIDVIRKYEIGLTRNLIAWGYKFDTFMEYLFPFHPVYGKWYFYLLRKGFPLLKRRLLTENQYLVPALYRWVDEVRRVFPFANISAIEKNLRRVAGSERLASTLHVGDWGEMGSDIMPVAENILDIDDFKALDLVTPKYRDWWGFPVCGFSGNFSGNERALFEEVKNDLSIKKVIFTLDKDVSLKGGENVEVVPLHSSRGQALLVRCGVVFVRHSPSRNIYYPLSPVLHNIINLWHGIPFKKIGYASEDMQDSLAAIAYEHAQCRAVIASSKMDAMAMAAAFYPLSINDVWNTGLPRNDFILRDEASLPSDMQDELVRLRSLVAGRRLVIFMPTFRNAQEDGSYVFSQDELSRLFGWAEKNNVVLGVREHMADISGSYSSLLLGRGGA